MRGLLTQIAVAIAVCAAFALPALAGSPTPENMVGNISGIIPTHQQAASHTAGSGGNLTYHNGPVMHTNTTYAIYWVPAGYSVSSQYQNVINGFFTNVAADSGKSSNVYFSDTQYYDNTNGNLLYSSGFGGSYLDTNALPASGCTDSYTRVCLSDSQLQAEVNRVVSLEGWPRGTGTEFFLFTANGIGSCINSSECAFSYYCAYHSHFGSGASTTLYANQPYANEVSGACGTGKAPNDADADATLNVTSHEHNETITDPLGNAWYDHRGAENGDKCAWNFGTATAANYNQTINGAHYYLQQEWSNRSSGCVLSGT